MYEPDRLRKLANRAGSRADEVRSRRLTYWGPRTNFFPHADRECKSLRSTAPVSREFTLLDMGGENWACHDCSLDPPDEGLAADLETFEGLEADIAGYVKFRSNADTASLSHLLEAFKWAWHGMDWARAYRFRLFGEYAVATGDGCLAYFSAAQQRWQRSHPRKLDGRLRLVEVSVRGLLDRDVDELDDLDQRVLTDGTLRRDGAEIKARLVVPAAMLGRSFHLSAHDLGPATVSKGHRRGAA